MDVLLFVQSFISETKEWCRAKQWWWRMPFILWFGFLLIGFLRDPKYFSVFDALNLGIHELGHMLFAWCGQFMAVAGGTITQLAAPVFGMWNFYQQRDFFAIALCFGWLSTNFFNVAVYMADARTMQLDLVAPFGGGDGGVQHDWNYLFFHTGLLEYDTSIALLTRILAVVSMFICLWFGGWILWQMMTSREIR